MLLILLIRSLQIFMLWQMNAGLRGLYSTPSMAGSQSNINALKQSPGYFALLQCFNLSYALSVRVDSQHRLRLARRLSKQANCIARPA